MRILVIEDEKRLAATLVDILENNGYSADSVHDGEEGLELAKSGIYDALILDVMLPGMNGYQILRALRSAHMAVPVPVSYTHLSVLSWRAAHSSSV